MRLVKRRHTTVERRLKSALRNSRLKFSSHRLVYGCTPDIVFSFERLAVFVDGDFWHGRLLVEKGERALEQSFGSKVRKFWVAKIARNVVRDRRQVGILRRNGWSVLRLWEKDVLRDPLASAAVIGRRLRRRRAQLNVD